MVHLNFFFCPLCFYGRLCMKDAIFFPFCSLIGFVDFVVCVITRFKVLFHFLFFGFVGPKPWVVVLWCWCFFPSWFSDWSCVFCVMVKLDLFCFMVWVLFHLFDLFVNLWFHLAPLFGLQEPKVSFSYDFVCFLWSNLWVLLGYFTNCGSLYRF